MLDQMPRALLDADDVLMEDDDVMIASFARSMEVRGVVAVERDILAVVVALVWLRFDVVW
jgi:ActR/RegA family two-component response regulator